MNLIEKAFKCAAQDDATGCHRSLQAAVQAHEIALRFLGRETLTSAQKQEVTKSLAQLDRALKTLKTIGFPAIPLDDFKHGPILAKPGEAAVQRAITTTEKTRQVVTDFVLIALQLGLDFADRSLLYANLGKEADSKRNLRAAKTAYEAILKFLPHATFTQAQFRMVEKDLARLRCSVNGNTV